MTDFETLRADIGRLKPGDRIYVLRVTGNIPAPAEAVLTRSGIFEGTRNGAVNPRERFRGAAPRAVLAMVKWDGDPKAEQQSQYTIGLQPGASPVCTTSLNGLRVKEGRPFKQREAFNIDL